MRRFFWSIVLLATLVGGSWSIYVGAQELATEIELVDSATDPRYQFIEHFYVQSTGASFEVFLRLDRETGQTWRFHASNPVWTPISEPSSEVLESEPGFNRYELKAHEYRDATGRQQELFLRVDYVAGKSWKYRGMAGEWTEVPLEEPVIKAVEPAVATTERQPATN